VKTGAEDRPHEPTSNRSNGVDRYVTPFPQQHVRYQDIDLTPRSDDQFHFTLGSPGSAIEREVERRTQMRKDTTPYSALAPKIAYIPPIEQTPPAPIQLTPPAPTKRVPRSAPTVRKVAFAPEVNGVETIRRPVEDFAPRQGKCFSSPS
jgi:hypothetical protein